MIITCDKPRNPEKPKAPPKSICHPHAQFIEEKLRADLTAKEIHGLLRTERQFQGAYPTVSVFVKNLRRKLFPEIHEPRAKPCLCEPHRELIASRLAAGASAAVIHEELTAQAGLDVSYPTVLRYARKLKAQLAQAGVSIAERASCAPHRAFVEERTRAGWMPMRIFKALKGEQQFKGSYIEVFRYVRKIKLAAVEQGQPIASGRSICFPHRAIIYAKARAGLSARRIFEDLKSEVSFTGSYEELYRFWRHFKRAALPHGALNPAKPLLTNTTGSTLPSAPGGGSVFQQNASQQ
jgi:hypothetical protein